MITDETRQTLNTIDSKQATEIQNRIEENIKAYQKAEKIETQIKQPIRNMFSNIRNATINERDIVENGQLDQNIRRNIPLTKFIVAVHLLGAVHVICQLALL